MVFAETIPTNRLRLPRNPLRVYNGPSQATARNRSQSEEVEMMVIRKLSGAFTGGAMGGLIDSVAIWTLANLGITKLLGVDLKPEFTAPWLYQRMVWGGIWMLLLLLPLWENRTVLRGCVFSLLPSAIMLFVVFPNMGKGLLGLGFGTLTPVVVIGLNCVYGMVAAFWYRASLHSG
jgi:hypothetical protein